MNADGAFVMSSTNYIFGDLQSNSVCVHLTMLKVEANRGITQPSKARTLLPPDKRLLSHSTLEEMKYLFEFVYPSLRSGVKANRDVEFNTQCLQIRQKVENRVS